MQHFAAQRHHRGDVPGRSPWQNRSPRPGARPIRCELLASSGPPRRGPWRATPGWPGAWSSHHRPITGSWGTTALFDGSSPGATAARPSRRGRGDIAVNACTCRRGPRGRWFCRTAGTLQAGTGPASGRAGPSDGESESCEAQAASTTPCATGKCLLGTDRSPGELASALGSSATRSGPRRAMRKDEAMARSARRSCEDARPDLAVLGRHTSHIPGPHGADRRCDLRWHRAGPEAVRW